MAVDKEVIDRIIAFRKLAWEILKQDLQKNPRPIAIERLAKFQAMYVVNGEIFHPGSK